MTTRHDGNVIITPADPGVGCFSTTLQVKKVVGYSSETGFDEHVTCVSANPGIAPNVVLPDDYLPFLSDGTPDDSSPLTWLARGR